MRVAGVDGCRGGWVMVELEFDQRLRPTRVAWFDSFNAVRRKTKGLKAVGVDIPIGVPNVIGSGGRECDVEARKLLGLPKGSSVFPTPPRALLGVKSYERATKLHRKHSKPRKGISRQAFNLIPKIAEVDRAISRRSQKKFIEVHPELTFRELNLGSTVESSKKSAAGLLKRLRLLNRVGVVEGLEELCDGLDSRAHLDDVLDATAVAWSAWRYASGEAVRIPDQPKRDARGLSMEIWR